MVYIQRTPKHHYQRILFPNRLYAFYISILVSTCRNIIYRIPSLSLRLLRTISKSAISYNFPLPVIFYPYPPRPASVHLSTRQAALNLPGSLLRLSTPFPILFRYHLSMFHVKQFNNNFVSLWPGI